MTRTAAREIIVHLAFGAGLNPGAICEILDTLFDRVYFDTLSAECEIYRSHPDEKQAAYIRRMAEGIYEHLAELDSYIEKYAKRWKVSRISKVAVAIMRTAMFEVMYMPEIPDAAAAGEAVKLAKKYEEPETVAFINGVLGSFIRGEIDG